MKKLRHTFSKKTLYAMCLILLAGCAATAIVHRGSISQKKLQDGVYSADYRKGPVKAVIEVEIKKNKILSVNILEHRTMRGQKAEAVIPNRIVQAQSTDVDVVSGATYSSLAIMNAAQLAIDKSAVADE